MAESNKNSDKTNDNDRNDALPIGLLPQAANSQTSSMAGNVSVPVNHASEFKHMVESMQKQLKEQSLALQDLQNSNLKLEKFNQKMIKTQEKTDQAIEYLKNEVKCLRINQNRISINTIVNWLQYELSFVEISEPYQSDQIVKLFEKYQLEDKLELKDAENMVSVLESIKTASQQVWISCGIHLYNPDQIGQYLSQYKIDGDVNETIKVLKLLKSAAKANQNKNDNDEQ